MDQSNFSEVELTNTTNFKSEDPNLPPDYHEKLEQFIDRQDLIQIKEYDSTEDDVPFDPDLIVDATYDWENDLPPSE